MSITALNLMSMSLTSDIYNTQTINSNERGSWDAINHNGQPVTIEWISNKAPPEVLQQEGVLCIPIYARAMAPFQTEQIEAFRKLPHDEQVKKDAYLSYPEDLSPDVLHPFLEASLISEYYKELESMSEESGSDDRYLVLAKDSNGEVLGFTQFSIKSNHPEKGAELEPIMIDPKAQGQGLARHLMFSIFTLRPDITRIFLCTNAKNYKAQEIYSHLGFNEFTRVKTDTLAWEYGTGILFEYLLNP